MTEVLDVQGDGRDDAIRRAAETLRSGQIVVLPTDTVYGVGADAFNVQGTHRVFQAKRRGSELPLPVLVHTPKQLVGICREVDERGERLMAAYWPGPLTLVVTEQPGLSWNLGRGDGTVAVRMPFDDVALDLIRAVGPLAVTSANRSGQPPATTAAEAADQLGDEVGLYLDDGPREGGVPSTIVDLTRRAASILRSGALEDEDVLAVASGELDPLEAASRIEDDRSDGR